MAEPLRWLSNVLPLSYATDAITKAGQQPALSSDVYRDAHSGAGLPARRRALAAATLRRRTA